MNSKEIFNKYYSRLALEGTIKAFIWGFILAFSLSFIAALIAFIVFIDGLWLSIGIGIAVSAVAIPIFYNKFFKPTSKAIARRVDRLGLNERLITMVELQKDESYMALVQREDAKNKLKTVNHKQVKLVFSAVQIIAVISLTVIAVAMTTISALSVRGYAPDWLPDSPGKGVETEDVYVEVNYIAHGGGRIEGEIHQIVRVGDDASLVMAIAEDGYVFNGWYIIAEVDGYPQFVFVSDSAERWDTNVKGDLLYRAWFDYLEDGPGSGEDDGPEEENPQPPRPDDTAEQDSGNSSGGEGPNEDGSNVGHEPNKSIIDGKIDYTSIFDVYYETVQQAINEGGEIPAHLIKFAEAYFKIIG